MTDWISRDDLLKKIKALKENVAEDFQADANVQMGYLNAVDDVIKTVLKLPAVR